MDTLGEGNQAGQHRLDSPGGSRDQRATGRASEPAVREPGEPGDLGFGIYVSCWGDRWRVQVSGKVDAAGAAAVLDVAEVLAAREAPAVDLDFSEVTAIDAKGWRAALYAQSLLAASGGGCRLISPASAVLHPSGSARHHAGHAA
ncbi:MAG: STAS domain-containing protein [Acidimicrobiaceae bacterium]|nr:STAS domain-containing protein [Acidimicrobiaceae bacterium]